MFKATVAQKPTIAVSEGTKTCRNSAVVLNLLGVLSTGPSPPAFLVIHHKRRTPTPSMNGAPIPSRNFIVSMPRQITSMLRDQKARKHAQETPVWPTIPGQSTPSKE